VFYIGCPIWGYKEWIGTFFPPHTPQKDFLRLYSQKLTAVEGNTTFYAVPPAATIARWRQDTPETFRFCFKIPRDISHSGLLAEAKEATQAFIHRMQGLGERLGPMFLQLPPSFGPDHLPQLQAFLNFWPQTPRLAVEVRHPAFFSEPHASALDNLLQMHQVGRVLMDTRPIRIGTAEERQILQARERKPDLPVVTVVASDFAFVRYIGHPRMEVNEPFLDTWAQQMTLWLRQGMTIFAFCHCPFEVHSPSICLELYRRVQALISLPALPWQKESTDSEPEQPTLF
jgi:uncharacterized protein YecE (DUF72 family)